jgi:putative transcriptional regulator
MRSRPSAARVIGLCTGDRDIGAELLQAVQQMKVGKATRVRHVEMPEALEARMRSGLAQAKFASVLAVSKRTLQEWEQGRRKPAGAACSLLTIATKRPEVLREVLTTPGDRQARPELR